MNPIWSGISLVIALPLAAAGGYVGIRRAVGDLTRKNFAGVPLPVVLGRVLVLAAQTGTLIAFWAASLEERISDWQLPLVIILGGGVMLLVGWLDDRSESGPRGIVGHMESLLRGRPTTGILKLVAGVAVAGVLAATIEATSGGGTVRQLLSWAVIALSMNVINALDVRPGRALKSAVVVLIPLTLWVRNEGAGLALAGYLGGSLGALPFDVRERAMLGDSGSNPLGMVVGTGLAVALPLPGLWVALGVLLGLQVAAETVTISRLIDAVPPLRWFDRLGRRN